MTESPPADDTKLLTKSGSEDAQEAAEDNRTDNTAAQESTKLSPEDDSDVTANKKRDRPPTPLTESPKVVEEPPASKRNRLQQSASNDTKPRSSSPVSSAEEEEPAVKATPTLVSGSPEKVITSEGSKVTAIRRQVAGMTTEDGVSVSDISNMSTRGSSPHLSELPAPSLESSSSPSTPVGSPKHTPISSTTSSKQPTFAAFSSSASPFSAVPTTSNISLSSNSAPNRNTFGGLAAASNAARASTPVPPSPTSSLRAEAGSVPPTSRPQSTRHSPDPEGAAELEKPRQKRNEDTTGGSGNLKSGSFTTFSSRGSPFASLNKSGDAGGASAENVAEGSNDANGKKSFGDILRDTTDNSPSTEGAEDKKNVEFTSQPTHTGEESEDVEHLVRCKLFILEDDNWKERGLGNLKVLSRDSEKGKSYRLVMRTDATFRLILNLPLFFGQKVEVVSDRYVKISGFEDDKPKSFTIKVKDISAANNLISAITQCVDGLGEQCTEGQ